MNQALNITSKKYMLFFLVEKKQHGFDRKICDVLEFAVAAGCSTATAYLWVNLLLN